MAENSLPISRLTLYKHGVGFVERAGVVQSGDIELVFRKEEVNDALKSLLVLDRQGGQIRGIHYETPGAKQPHENPFQLDPSSSLFDLLRALRGRQVRLSLGEGSTVQTLSGQLVGVEQDPQKPNRLSSVTLQTLEGDQPILVLPLHEIREIYLLEERSRQDLRFFLESSRNDETHLTVTLEMDAAQQGHDLHVSYLMPCPTWRVSYRLVAETANAPAETGENAPKIAEDRRGELLLQGWGLFDNRLEEDLNEVFVKLVAGQPISFIYDLTTSKIPQRPFVQDEARIAAGPVQFDAVAPMREEAYFAADMEMETMSFAPAAAPMMVPSGQSAGLARGRAAPPPMPKKAALANQPVAAKGGDLGELFQYEVTAPVTVKRGESALVPIMNTTLPYRHELLYNGQKMPKHPVAALRFENKTGLVLERGPVTIVEDDEYRGEALISFTPQEQEVYLAYAVELGIKVTEDTQSRSQTTGIRIDKDYMYFDQEIILTTTYQIENNLAQSRVVTIEKPVQSGYQVTSGAPNEQTAEFYRWKVPGKGKTLTTFKVEERTKTYQSQTVLSQNYANLEYYLANKWITPEVMEKIRELLAEQDAINRQQATITKAEAEREKIYRRQEQLRQNMAALSINGEEGVLRHKVFTQLSQSEDRVNEIEQTVRAANEEIKRRQAELERKVKALKS
jgi:hypothetical protein